MSSANLTAATLRPAQNRQLPGKNVQLAMSSMLPIDGVDSGGPPGTMLT
jgi:hypothetical protein